jgi:hypothetical protein
VTAETSPSVRYRFGDSARAGVVLGLSLRQSLPLIVGAGWLTLCLAAGQPVPGMVGVFVGGVVAFGRWRRAPLYEVAVPGLRLVWARLRRRGPWVRASLLGAGLGWDDQLPPALAGLELLEHRLDWPPQPVDAAVVRDRRAGSVSIVLPVQGSGFPVASLREQDGLLAAWGAALAPLARAHCPVSRVTWHEWAHPVGVAGHREFLASLDRPATTAATDDYDELLAVQAPVTIAHEVLVSLTVDIRRVRAPRGSSSAASAIDMLADSVRLLASRLESAGLQVGAPLSPLELSTAVRLRSDPSRPTQVGALRRSLAAATGRGALEWGPMAVEAEWFHARADGAVHRTYRIAGWPMLPVTADWLAPLLMGDGVTRTVTVVMEPVPLARAAADANRQLTSIESDHAQKERHGFRLTARERRRQADVEGRERELAEGHPEFRHAGFVTVTAIDLVGLEEAASRVEQAAAQSMLDLRPLAARQSEGWVASLPLGRSIRNGGWA